jgi:cytochrome c-type biogenesis protein
MGGVLASVSTAFSTAGPLALGAALIWGVLSVVLSPCHLGSIPLIIAYIHNGTKPDRREAFSLSLLFALGLLVMLALVGVLTSAAGRLMGDVGGSLIIFISLLLILCGLWLMDIPPFSKISFAVHPRFQQRGRFGAFSLGLFYGILLGPCSFAFLAPILLYIFSSAMTKFSFGILLMISYAIGHTAAIVAAGTFGHLVSGVLHKKWSERGSLWFKRGLGVVVVLVGISQLL